MTAEYRLIHFNCARPLGAFNYDNEFVRVFMAILPRIFSDADQFEGLQWHAHGIRQPNGVWLNLDKVFPYPEDQGTPEVCTMAGWKDVETLRDFTYNGKTHPPSMRRLSQHIDRSSGAGFVLWWAPRGQRFTLEEGWERLQKLRQHGPSPEAFTLDQMMAKPVAA